MSIDQEAWKKFLSGHWQKEMPALVGTFPLASRGGDTGPTTHGGVYQDKQGLCWPSMPWRGWWWSEPIPSLPKPPPWEVES